MKDCLEALDLYSQIIEEQAGIIDRLTQLTKRQAERLRNYENIEELEKEIKEAGIK